MTEHKEKQKYSVSVLDKWIADKHLDGMGTRKELEKWQLQKLQELILYAKEHSPYYAQAMEKFPLPESLEEFQNYPTMDAEDLKAQGMKLLCVSQREISRVVSLETSGTSSAPKRIFFTKEDQELTIDFFHYGMEELVSKGACTAVCLPWKSESCVGDLLMKGLGRLGVKTCGIGIIRNLKEAAEQIEREQAEAAVGIPVQILALMEYMRAAGKTCPIKKVLLSTDRLPNAIRKRLNDEGIQVFNHFGMTECGLGVALECKAHEGMHIRENDLYMEILDKNGKQVPDGEWGELAVTTLTRKGMPMIRYRSGDIARFLPGKCPCGSILKRLDQVPGRFSEEKGLNRRMQEWDEEIFSVQGVVDYHMSVNQDSVLCLEIDVIGADVEAVREKILKKSILQKNEKYSVSCRVITDELPFYEGKRRIRRKE